MVVSQGGNLGNITIALNFRDFLGDPQWLHVNDVRVVTSISFNPSNRILFDHERGNLDPGFPRKASDTGRTRPPRQPSPPAPDASPPLRTGRALRAERTGARSPATGVHSHQTPGEGPIGHARP